MGHIHQSFKLVLPLVKKRSSDVALFLVFRLQMFMENLGAGCDDTLQDAQGGCNFQNFLWTSEALR
ncbi:hypothetical protein SDJN02_15322, partial [Cucurbita argyrosperma subsp. argyrosperma]